jgi:alkanesulfonate monooxygenase SsuD/methylene tetrahydromethanopterin reductase-like flavin-dependent oxidoreductase (luciferase family)
MSKTGYAEVKMNVGVGIPAMGSLARGDVVRTAIMAAEELGYYSAWFADHVAVPHYAVENRKLETEYYEPLAACAWGLGRTTRLRFGTDILVLPYRQPLLVAAMAATLGQLSDDRLVLGVGVGYLRGEFEALEVPGYEQRGELTNRHLARLRNAWAGKSGYHVLPGSAPLWVGGNVRAALRRAALFGDGWQPLWLTPERYAKAREEIQTIRADAGIDRPFTFSLSTMANITDTPRKWNTPPPRAVGEFGYQPERALASDGRPRCFGTIEQVADDLRELEAVGVEHVVIRFRAKSQDDFTRQLEALATLLPLQ